MPEGIKTTQPQTSFRPIHEANRSDQGPKARVLTRFLDLDGYDNDVAFSSDKLAPGTPKSTEKALHRLIYYKNGDDLREAIKSGEFVKEDLNRPMIGGRHYPLHLVRTADMAQALIEFGADPTKKNALGQTALERAQEQFKQGRVDTDLVTCLKGVGRKPAEQNLENMILKEPPLVLEASIAVGETTPKQLNAPLHEGKWYPIHLAKSPEMLHLLIENGVDVNQRAGEAALDQTPIHRNITRTDLLEVLLEAGADPNIPDGRGRTPLRRAIDMGLKDVQKLLLKFDAMETR